jgi:hypothetical protein
MKAKEMCFLILTATLVCLVQNFLFSQTTLPVIRTAWSTTPTGWTDQGTSSYSTNFACSGNDMGQMLSNGNYYQVYFNGSPGQLSYYLKSTGNSTSSCLVEESADGTVWSTVTNHTSLPTSCTQFVFNLSATSRYVKWTYTKTTENLGLDDVDISVLTTQTYYRSKQNGNWTNVNTWESSPDNSNWFNASATPTNSDATITIQSGHTVYIDASTTFDGTVIQNGATLQLNQGVSAILANGVGTDLDCSGTFINAGSITWNGTMTIETGATYVHNTSSSSSNARDAATLLAGSYWVFRGSTGNTPSVAFSGKTFQNLSFECTAGSYSVSVSGGSTFTVQGDFSIGAGVNLTNNMSATNNYAGNFTVYGTLVNNTTGSMNFNGNFSNYGTITNSSTGTNAFAANFENNGTINNSIGTQNYSFLGAGKTIGGTSSTAFEALSINLGAVITLESNISILSGFTGTNNGTLNCGTNTISGAGTFALASGSTIITSNPNGISGTVTSAKSFDSGANYEFQGASTGTFPSSPFTVNNLTINSPTSDVLLGQNLTSTGTLSLTSGKLNLNGFTLTFSGSVAGIPAWGSSTSNYIIASTGFLVRNDPGNTIFPVGTASQYLPCKLTGGGAYYVNLSSPPSPGLTQPSLALPNQWNITGSGSTSMDFQWPSDIFGTLAYLYKYDGANWTNAAGPTTTNGTGPITVGFSGIEVTCCTGFTVGGLGALPVELVYFTAEASDETTVLTWQTASERNNDYFSIQKSSDGLDFMEIGQVLGNGTSLETNAYTFTDERPVVGLNYYRLKQVDFDGQFTYSKIVSVKMTSKASFEVYPSITSGDLTIKSTDEGQDVQEILIFDSMGRLAHSYEVEESGPYTKLNVAGLPNGAYYLKIATGRRHETLRFTKI